MPYIGVGLSTLIALFFAVHAVRHRQELYWLFILFFFPFLGSVVYFFAIYLPSSRLERGAKRAANVAVSAAIKALDPKRELREAREAFDYTPTAQNQIRLANALLDAGQADEAADNFEACLKGPFASDPEIRVSAATACLNSKRYAQAQAHLSTLQARHANFRPERVALLVARTLAALGDHDAAKAAFEAALQRHGSFEVRAEYAIWAAQSGERDTAEALKVELDRTMQRWTKHSRELNATLVRRLNSAFQSIGKPA